MDANTRRLIKERFDKSFNLRTERARLETRLTVLEEENQSAQNIIREKDAALQELEGFLPSLLTEQAARFERSFELRTEKIKLESKLTALENEYQEIQKRLGLITTELGEVEMLTVDMLGVGNAPRPRGRPRKLDPVSGAPLNSNGTRPGRALGVIPPPSLQQNGIDRKTKRTFDRPSLYDCITNSPPILETDQVGSSRGGGITMLSKHHPTIVRLNNLWTQIWCPDCGDNSCHDGSFFMGMAGLHGHMRRGPCNVQGTEKVMFEDVVVKCGRYILSNVELEDLRSGKKQIRRRRGGKEYGVPPVQPENSKFTQGDQAQGHPPTIGATQEIREAAAPNAELPESPNNDSQNQKHQETSLHEYRNQSSSSSSSSEPVSPHTRENTMSSSIIREIKQEPNADEMPTPFTSNEKKRKSALDEFLESAREKRARSGEVLSTQLSGGEGREAAVMGRTHG